MESKDIWIKQYVTLSKDHYNPQLHINITLQADQLPDNFTGHLKLCQAFFKLRLQRNVEILDVSAHVSTPGLVGRELQARSVTMVTLLVGNAQ